MSVVVYAVLAYLLIGLLVAIPFALRGAARALPEPASLTRGARILLVPGALLLWPLVALRSLAGARR